MVCLTVFFLPTVTEKNTYICPYIAINARWNVSQMHGVYLPYLSWKEPKENILNREAQLKKINRNELKVIGWNFYHVQSGNIRLIYKKACLLLVQVATHGVRHRPVVSRYVQWCLSKAFSKAGLAVASSLFSGFRAQLAAITSGFCKN